MQKITVKQAITGAAKFAGAQFLPVTPLSQWRVQICEQCPLFDTTSRRCRECGCFVDQKSKYQSEQCPIGRW